jgi:hypothetical protein
MRQGNFENIQLPDEEPNNEEVTDEQKPKRKTVNIPLLEIEAETKLAHRGEVIGHDDDLKDELRVHQIVNQAFYDEKMEDVQETVGMVFEKINSLKSQLAVHEETLLDVERDLELLYEK